MSKKTTWPIKTIIGIGLSAVLTALIMYLLSGKTIAVLQPAGTIADQQKQLILWTCALSLVVVVPVFIMTFYIVWKYRASSKNKKSRYSPDMHSNALAETIWWLVPLVLILILAIVTWVTSHKLDPYRPLDSSIKPVRVQVVALNWKWLFIYPDQRIATVNYLQIPTHTPIDFSITADAPMNSFWIPRLGGQVYAMAGMTTQLHLMAGKEGVYRGSSANLSGEGFSGMTFNTKAAGRSDFDKWVQSVQQSGHGLTAEAYSQLARPSKDMPVTVYGSYDKGLYDTIQMKYMMPSSGSNGNGAASHRNKANDMPAGHDMSAMDHMEHMQH